METAHQISVDNRSGAAGTRSVARTSRIGLLPAASGIILGLFIAVGVVGPYVTPHDPIIGNLLYKSSAPIGFSGYTDGYYLGADDLGRDLLSRLMGGARISLIVSFLGTLFSALIGSVVGLVAGYYGGWVDFLAMRIVDIALSIPPLLLAIVMVAALRPSLVNVIIAGALLLWPVFARQIRAETLAIKEEVFIDAARAIGAPARRIMARHTLPNLVPTMMVLATLQIPQIIILEASLSFLGVGVPPPAPSWGSMISGGEPYIFTSWWMVVFPSAAIAIVILSLTYLGDWLRDRLDPRLARRGV